VRTGVTGSRIGRELERARDQLQSFLDEREAEEAEKDFVAAA
jgi:hypothetical protein